MNSFSINNGASHVCTYECVIHLCDLKINMNGLFHKILRFSQNCFFYMHQWRNICFRQCLLLSLFVSQKQFDPRSRTCHIDLGWQPDPRTDLKLLFNTKGVYDRPLCWPWLQFCCLCFLIQHKFSVISLWYKFLQFLKEKSDVNIACICIFCILKWMK